MDRGIRGCRRMRLSSRSKTRLRFVGLDFETFASRSPFQLPEANAPRGDCGVIAMDPDYLILDEPSAGLDPRSRDAVFAEIMALYKKTPDGCDFSYAQYGRSSPLQ